MHYINSHLTYLLTYLRGTNLYHSRQCGIILKPCSDRIDFRTHDCSGKLWKQYWCTL